MLLARGYFLRSPSSPKNLRAASSGEHYEWEEMYPSFAATVREEGFEAIAIAEKQHERRYVGLVENIKAGTVFEKDKPVVWRCLNCGYLHMGVEAPGICSACAHPQAYFEILAENW